MTLKETLESWQKDLDIESLPIPIETQCQYLSKKYDTTIERFKVKEYNPKTDKEEVVDKDFLLIRFKDIVIKYRPHLKMGDFWLRVQIVGKQVNYMFLKLVKYSEKEQFQIADHPHLSNGRPCFGSFQGDISTSLSQGNFMRFMSQMKLYLSSYYGRSTYVTGKYFKPIFLTYRLHSDDEVVNMFAAEQSEEERHNFQLYQVATDPTRWNYPKNIVPFGSFIVESKDRINMMTFMKCGRWMHRRTGNPHRANDDYFPYLSDVTPSEAQYTDIQTWHGEMSQRIAKINGYIYLAITLGEMHPLHAAEFVRIFLLKLYKEYSGELTDDMIKELERMSNKLSEYTSGGNDWNVNTRYHVKFSDKMKQVKRDLQRKVNKSKDNSIGFINNLKYAGHKISNFMILLRKKSPHKGNFNTYMEGEPTKDSFKETHKEFKMLEKYAYREALNILEKDRRRFINELSKDKTINLENDDAQGSLFSEEV